MTFVYEIAAHADRDALRGAAAGLSRAGHRAGGPADEGRAARIEAGPAVAAPAAQRARRTAQSRGDGGARRAGAARRVSGRHPRRRRDEGMNIQQMMKQAQQMQEQAAEAGGPDAGRRHRRRRHGHRRHERPEAGAVAHDRSRGRLEGRRRDAAGHDPRGVRRRPAKVDEDMKQQVGGMLGGMGIPGF